MRSVNQQSTSANIQIRTLTTSAEMDLFFRLNAAVFSPEEDLDLSTAHRRRFLMDDPDFPLHRIRGAFLGDVYIGGYALLERNICLGPARLRIGCLNCVATHPDYRYQGVAHALMYDAIHIAESQHYALLLLDGIANFYHKFGYVDVLEGIPQHFINRQDLPNPLPDMYTVRTATLADAPAFLTCYQRHYSSYLGSFAPTRTLQRQEHLLANWFEATDAQALIALDPEQRLHGYLMVSWKRHRLYTYEAATDTWEATLALLHAHAQLLDVESDSSQELMWPLPPTDPTFYFLAQHLLVRSNLHSIPHGGWMARPIHLPTLVQSVLPLWQAYWQDRSRLVDWTGTFALTIDDHTSFLQVTPTDIYPVATSSTSTLQVICSPQIFAQLIFGFRPLSWAELQPGQQFPAEIMSVLTTLFPVGQAWIAGSDAF